MCGKFVTTNPALPYSRRMILTKKNLKKKKFSPLHEQTIYTFLAVAVSRRGPFEWFENNCFTREKKRIQ